MAERCLYIESWVSLLSSIYHLPLHVTLHCLYGTDSFSLHPVQILCLNLFFSRIVKVHILLGGRSAFISDTGLCCFLPPQLKQLTDIIVTGTKLSVVFSLSHHKRVTYLELYFFTTFLNRGVQKLISTSVSSEIFRLVGFSRKEREENVRGSSRRHDITQTQLISLCSMEKQQNSWYSKGLYIIELII